MVLLEFFHQSSPLLKTIFLGLFVFVIYTIVAKIVQLRKTFLYYNSLPGETNFSFITGNMHMIPSNGEQRLKYFQSLRDLNGRYARIWNGPFTPFILLFHPDVMKIIYKSSAPKNRGFARAYDNIKPWIGEGLIVSNGHTWARSRRLLTPAFHFNILKSYIKVFNKSTDTLINKLDVHSESGDKFDICPSIKSCTLDSILKCAMSYDEDVQKHENHPYCAALTKMNTILEMRSRTIYMWPNFIFRLTNSGRTFYKCCDYVHKVAEEVIQKRKETREREGPPKNKHLDFLDILLTARDEDGKPMTDLEIRSEVDTFMFAGHDTTAAGAPWILYCLAKHPDHQKKVQEELDQILDGKDLIEWDDLAKLTYLTLCIKESFRLFSPVPNTQRRLNEDIEIDGVRIEKGVGIGMRIHQMHHNPNVWENPEEFIPERFLKENLEDKDSFAFVPFAAGSRNCIGQNFAMAEEKVMIARILKRYTVEWAKDGPPIERTAATVLKADHGIWMRLKKRNI